MTPTDKTLITCKEYWEATGVGPADIEDMRAELRNHLDEATARGRRVEDVVGPDLRDFAIAWARARTAPWPRWIRRIAYGFGTLVILLLVGHLVRTTTELPIRPAHLAGMVSAVALLVLWRPAWGPPSFPRMLLFTGVAAAIGTVVVGRLITDRVLFHLPLWITGPLGLAVAAWTWWEETRDRHHDQRSRGRIG
jgi:hypothetical protein